MSTSSSVGAACLAVLITASSAAAQGAPETSPGAGTISEVIVTAQRREQSLQKTPIAVSAFTAAALEQAHVTSALDIVRLVPNLIGTHNTGVGTANTYYLRGLGNTESISTFDPAVATYVDDVIIARQNANDFNFFDIDRVEVLRGPQGTLFGRNTTGGAINFILKKPSDHITGFLESQYGSYEQFGVRGSIDLPVVSDMVLTKFSFFDYKNNGYAHNVTVDRDINGLNSRGGRVAVRLLPTKNVTWDLSADYIYADEPFNLDAPDAAGDLVAHSGLTRYALEPFLTGAKARQDPFQAETGSASVTSNLQWDLDGIKLNAITGYRNTRQQFLADGLGELAQRSVGYFPNATTGIFKQVSQELKASGHAFDDKLEYVLGYFYIHEDNSQDLGSGIGLSATKLLVTGDRTVQSTTDANAVYAQVDYHFLPQWTATAGLRYTDETKKLNAYRNPGAAGPAISDAGIVAAGIPLSLETPLLTPHFSLDYQIDPNTMVYASATRGFKSGGWNARATSNALFTTFSPEKVWSEELGLRSEFLQHTLRLNTTLFHFLDEKAQEPAAVFANGAITYTTTNPADLENYGAEFEVTWLPIERLTLGSTLGLQDARFVNLSNAVKTQQASCRAKPGAANTNCNAGFVDIFGNLAAPLRAPTATWSFLAAYALDTNWAKITPNAGLSLHSGQSIGTAGSEKASSSPVAAASVNWVGTQWLLNLGLTIAPTAFPKIAITAECKNCLMKDYASTALGPLQYFDPPGTWDVRVNYKF